MARPRSHFTVVWLGVVAVFGGLLLWSAHLDGPLDDPDPAYQRPGFLDAGGAPRLAPALPGISCGAVRVVAFFVRAEQLDGLESALADDRRLRDRVCTAVVLESGAPRPSPAAGVLVVLDRAGAIASALGMRTPRDGGRPVGYAILDSSHAVRYTTLDPGVAGRLGEVATIVNATP